MSLYKIFWAWIVRSLTAAWLPGLSTAAPTVSDRVNILFIAKRGERFLPLLQTAINATGPLGLGHNP